MKIAIVGAGIAGLSCALALQQQGFEVQVFEKAKQLKNIGGGILLWPHAQYYLKLLGLELKLQPYQIDILACRIINHQRHTYFYDNYQMLKENLGGMILPLERSSLQHILFAALQSDTVKLHAPCSAIQQLNDGAEVICGDHRYQADMVIIADGNFSTGCKLLGLDDQLEYSGFAWWGGIIADKQLKKYYRSDEVTVGLGLHSFNVLWPLVNDRFMWYSAVSLEQALLNKQRGLDQLHDLQISSHALVADFLQAEQLRPYFQLPVYRRVPTPNWSQGCVVMVGDAAHAMGPMLGLGANQAIEDAVVLSSLLANSGDIAASIEAFMHSTWQRNQQFHQYEVESSALLISANNEHLSALEQQLGSLTLVELYAEIFPLLNVNHVKNLFNLKDKNYAFCKA